MFEGVFFFLKICRGESKFDQKCDRITGSLHEDQCRFMIIFRSFRLRIRSVSDKSCRENKNIYFMFKTFSPNIMRFMRSCGKMWYSQTAHGIQYNTAHGLCLPDNKGYQHTLKICNTYCFSTATIVIRTLMKRSNLMQQYADIYLLQGHSACFGCHSTHHQEH